MKTHTKISIALVAIILTVTVMLISVLQINKESEKKQVQRSQKKANEVRAFGAPQTQLEINSFGMLKSEKHTILSSEVSGLIVSRELEAREGSLVKQNDLLFEIDARDILAQLEQVKIKADGLMINKEKLLVQLEKQKKELAIQKELFEIAEKEKNRYLELAKEAHLSEESYLNINKNYLIQKSRLSENEWILQNIPLQMKETENGILELNAQKTILENQLARTKIKAPFTGVIKNIQVDVGGKVQPGSILCEIFDPFSWEVHVKVSLSQMKKMELAREAVFIQMADERALFKRFDADFDKKTRTLSAIFPYKVAKINPSLLPDMILSQTIVIPTPPYWRVPKNAIQNQNIYIMANKEENTKPVKSTIELLYQDESVCCIVGNFKEQAYFLMDASSYMVSANLSDEEK